MYVWEIYDGLVFLFIKSLRTCIFLRLFLLRDFVACFASPILRRSCADLYFIFLLVDAYLPYLLSSRFYRWAEMSDITTVDSYYKGSGTSEPTSERSLPRSSLRPLRGSAIHSSAASPVLLRRLFYPLDSWCLRDLICNVWEIWSIMYEILNGYVWEIGFIMYEILIHYVWDIEWLCMRDLIHDVREIYYGLVF